MLKVESLDRPFRPEFAASEMMVGSLSQTDLDTLPPDDANGAFIMQDSSGISGCSPTCGLNYHPPRHWTEINPYPNTCPDAHPVDSFTPHADRPAGGDDAVD